MHILIGALVGAVIGAVASVVVAKATGRPVTWRGVLAGAVGGAVGGAITAATFGAGAPEGEAVGGALAAELTGFAVGGGAGAGAQQVTENALDGRPLAEGVPQAVALGTASGLVLGGAGKVVAVGARSAAPAVARALGIGARDVASDAAGSGGRGISQAIEDLTGGRGSPPEVRAGVPEPGNGAPATPRGPPATDPANAPAAAPPSDPGAPAAAPHAEPNAATPSAPSRPGAFDPATNPSAGVVERGAGGNDYGLAPGRGGVEPLSPIEGADRAAVDDAIRATDSFRTNGPRVLSDEELAALERGRSSPSNTIRTGGAGADTGYSSAARQVNAWARAGDDLDLAKMKQLNRLLEQGENPDKAGVLRSELAPDEPWRFVGHRTADGSGYMYAHPDHVDAYLNDFLTWYRANEGTMPPVELAAKAYQQLVRIHPFANGNGRTTRLVMDFILQRNGLPPATFDGISSEAVHASSADLTRRIGEGVLQAEHTLSGAH